MRMSCSFEFIQFNIILLKNCSNSSSDNIMILYYCYTMITGFGLEKG